jgi:uncharacterized protein YbjT (DUF2867 family)
MNLSFSTMVRLTRLGSNEDRPIESSYREKLMFTIAGATGRVGSAVADRLLTAGEKIEVLVRDEAKGAAWANRGAAVRTVDLGNRAGLVEALRGSRGFFTLLPFNLGVPDMEADQRRLAESISDAVRDAAVPHVVLLSSVGAELPSGTGPIRWLHDLEGLLRDTGAVVTAVRSAHFQEKVSDVLGAVQETGVYPVFADSADRPIPMVATRDVAAVIAAALQAPPPAHETVDVEGPAYTEREVADRLGDLLGRPLDVVTVPQPGWVGSLVDAGLPVAAAELLAELYDADQHGRLVPGGDRHVRGETPLGRTLRDLVRSWSTVSAG